MEDAPHRQHWRVQQTACRSRAALSAPVKFYGCSKRIVPKRCLLPRRDAHNRCGNPGPRARLRTLGATKLHQVPALAPRKSVFLQHRLCRARQPAVKRLAKLREWACGILRASRRLGRRRPHRRHSILCPEDDAHGLDLLRFFLLSKSISGLSIIHSILFRASSGLKPRKLSLTCNSKRATLLLGARPGSSAFAGGGAKEVDPDEDESLSDSSCCSQTPSGAI